MYKKIISIMVLVLFCFLIPTKATPLVKGEKINIQVISFVKEINEFNRVVIRVKTSMIKRTIIKIRQNKLKYIIYIRLLSKDYIGRKIFLYNNKYWIVPIPNKYYGIMIIKKEAK